MPCGPATKPPEGWGEKVGRGLGTELFFKVNGGQSNGESGTLTAAHDGWQERAKESL